MHVKKKCKEIDINILNMPLSLKLCGYVSVLEFIIKNTKAFISNNKITLDCLFALTCDICGLRLISFRLMVSDLRLFSSWHRSTPSRRVWAKSKTCAESAVTR